MKTRTTTGPNTEIARHVLTGLVLAAAMIGPPRTLAAGPESVDLGSAAHFTILAGTAISSTGGGTNNGDVGLSPTTGAGITGLTTNRVNGIIYAVDAAGPEGSMVAPELLTTAKVDLVTAYADAAGRSVDRITKSGDIGGQTLAPGLYWSSSTLYITGDLTLDAGGDPNAVWIFQMGETLTTAAGAPGSPASRVLLAGDAQARNVFWQVGSSATLGTYSVFKGTILALVSITMDTGCTVEGRALARNAQVTFNGQILGQPTPEAPLFTRIAPTPPESVILDVSTTPYFLLTLQTCPDLRFTNWTPLAADTPTTNVCTFIDNTVLASVTQRFYRAVLTAY